MAVDIVSFYCSLLTAFYTRKFLTALVPDVHALQLSFLYFLKIWWLPVVFICFIAYERLYNKNLTFWDETRIILKAVTVSVMIVMGMLTIGRLTPDISRLAVIFLWLYGLFIFPFFRFLGKKWLYRIGVWKEKVIILGAGKTGIEAAKGIHAEPHLGYTIIGFLDDAVGEIGNKLTIDGKHYKIFGKTKNFKKFVRMMNISTIIIAIPSLPLEELTELIGTIQKHTKNILLIPDWKGIAMTNSELDYLFFQQLFLLKIDNNLKSPFNRFIKRTFDLCVSILFLPLLLPLIVILGLLIKIDSPGPVLYRHKRIGRGGKPFGVFKFRSMYEDSDERLQKILANDAEAKKEWDASFKLKNDPRVTRMGNFLRRTSLDELPQVLNVLKGEMSLVGPRPVMCEELVKYYKTDADYYYLVRPGITGLWQVSGRSNVDYDVRVKLDTWYVLNWTVWLDSLMLIKTIRVLLKGEGAY